MAEGVFDPEVYGEPVYTDNQADTEVYGELGDDVTGVTTSNAYGQAQADILHTYQGYGQCQADIKHTYQGYGQAQSDIKQTYQGYGQCQAQIINTYQAYGQCQADIKSTRNGFGQCQADIKATSNGYGQCQADIKQTSQGYGQSQGQITNTYQGYGQCQALIIPTRAYGQAQGDIKQTYQGYGQAQGDIKQTYQACAQAQACVIGWGFGQAQSDIKQTYNGFAQANCAIKITVNAYAQCQAQIKIIGLGFGQCQAKISRDFFAGNGQAQADIKASSSKFAQANANIDSPIKVQSGCAQAFIAKSTAFGQAAAWIWTGRVWAQAQADIKRAYRANGCARAFLINKKKHGLAMADIKKTTRASAYAVGFIFHPRGVGQAQAYISPSVGRNYAQANAIIWNGYKVGQAQALIILSDSRAFGQALAGIRVFRVQAYGQAQATIFKIVFGQAQAYIGSAIAIMSGQAMAHILGNTAYGQAQALIFREGVLLRDTFTRTTSFGDSLGTPDYGPDWDNFSGDTDSGRLDGTRLDFDFDETDFSFTYVYSFSPINTSNITLYSEFSSTVDNNYAYFEARDNFVWVQRNMSFNQWQMFAVNSVTFPTATYDTTAGVTYSIRLWILDKTVKFKIWPTGTPEPDAWLITLTDAAITPHAGSVGILYDNETNDNSTYPVGHTYADNINVEYTGTAKNAQAQGFISQPHPRQYGQAQGFISQPHPYQFGQAQAIIKLTSIGQAQAYIISISKKYGQAQAKIIGNTGYGQAQALIVQSIQYGQAQALIASSYAWANAQAFIASRLVFGQANAKIFFPWAFAQAKARINQYPRKYAQAQAYIFGAQVGQAQALIDNGQKKLGQAQAYISSKSNKYGQARALIVNNKKHGQALAIINNTTAVNNDPSIRTPVYTVKYNEYTLPGYAQEEIMEAPMNINTVGGRMWNIPFSEYIGLENKLISLRMKVIGTDYLDVKTQSQRAATIVRTKRSGFAKLYIQYPDRYYEAITRTIKIDNSATGTTAFDYNLQFEAKPWLTSDLVFTETGTGLVTTAGRTINDGGWTPTTIRMTGTNITVSGYTATGDYAGFVSVSGFVSNLEIDSETMDTNIDGVFLNQDYRIYVGPGVTNFQVTGATDFTVSYRNRWYL